MIPLFHSPKGVHNTHLLWYFISSNTLQGEAMNTTIHDGLPAQYTRTVNSNKNHEIYFYFFFKKKREITVIPTRFSLRPGLVLYNLILSI